MSQKKATNKYLFKRKHKTLDKKDNDYRAKIIYGYLTVLAATLSFAGMLLLGYYLELHSTWYLNILEIYQAALHGFIRTVLIVIITIVPICMCQHYARVRPLLSMIFFLLSLIVLLPQVGLPVLWFKELAVTVVLETIMLTFILCTVGIITQKDLSNFNNILSLGLLGLISTTFLNIQFLHIPLLVSLLSYASIFIFLGYLVYDSNTAMNSYTEAKKLSGLFFISILLANSLNILQDIIIIFLESLGSSGDGGILEDIDDNDSSGGFDSFW